MTNDLMTPNHVPLKSRDVMLRLGYRDPKSFWLAVHREGIPHSRISCRKIVFWESQLNEWISKRSTRPSS